MYRTNRRSQPGLVEIRTDARAFRHDDSRPARSRGDAASSLPAAARDGVASLLRLVGCETKPSFETPRLGHWGRSIARSENRRMEHLARMLGLSPGGFDGGLPPAA